jgi:hypothetical protein
MRSRRALHALLAAIAVCAIVGCSKREDSKSTRPALTAGEVGTVTCDRLVTYERACLKELLPEFESMREPSLATLQRSIDAWHQVLHSDRDDAVKVVEEMCQNGLAVLRPQLAQACPTVKEPTP